MQQINRTEEFRVSFLLRKLKGNYVPRLIIPTDGIEDRTDLINPIIQNKHELTSLLTESESLQLVTIHNSWYKSAIKVIL